MKKRIIANDGKIIIDQLATPCVNCILSINQDSAAVICPMNQAQRRIAHVKTVHGEIMSCSEGCKTTSNFRKEVLATTEMLPFISTLSSQVHNEAKRRLETRYLQLVHNLKTINAHCIQELYDLSPSGDHKSVRDAIENTKNAIRDDIDLAALTFFHLQKYVSMMNVEFLVYERMQIDKVELSLGNYKVRDVVMKTLHMFFDDFTSKSVNVTIARNYDRVMMDYESVATALYYIIENATKYIQPSTELSIDFEKTDELYNIRLFMYSYYLTENDREHMFENGYSGEMAISQKTSGHGYGMFRAHRLIEQCGGRLFVKAGNNPFVCQGIRYAYNSFVISLPVVE